MVADDRNELVIRLLGPSEPELTCELCFEMLDEYVDAELAGRDPDTEIRGMKAHLQGCPACHEDHETLRAFVAAQDGAGGAP